MSQNSNFPKLSFIEVNGLDNFLKNEDEDSAPKEIIDAILRRVDSTGEGYINFKDFEKFLMPLEEKRIRKIESRQSSVDRSVDRSVERSVERSVGRSEIKNEYSPNLYQRKYYSCLTLISISSCIKNKARF